MGLNTFQALKMLKILILVHALMLTEKIEIYFATIFIMMSVVSNAVHFKRHISSFWRFFFCRVKY